MSDSTPFTSKLSSPSRSDSTNSTPPGKKSPWPKVHCAPRTRLRKQDERALKDIRVGCKSIVKARSSCLRNRVRRAQRTFGHGDLLPGRVEFVESLRDGEDNFC